jgi:bacterioferritin-associated ferredoxin
MYICICKNVTDRQIRKVAHERGVNNLRQLRECLGACDQCGKCARDAMDIIRDVAAEKRSAEQPMDLAA